MNMHQPRRCRDAKPIIASNGDVHDQRGHSPGLAQPPGKPTSPPKRHRRFLFVPALDRDQRTRRTMRAHVMHNYLDKTDDKEQDPPEARETPVTGGETMRFRLTSNGLERRYPYWYVKSQTAEDRQKSGDGSVSTRSSSLIAHQRGGADASHQVLAYTVSTSRSTARSWGVHDDNPMMNDPWLNIGLGQIDPVGAFPFELDAMDETFLDRFQHYKRWPWCPVRSKRLWAPFAMSDKLVFHATMFSWGMHFRSRFGLEPRQQAKILQHKTAAISIINARISNPDFVTKHETLAAVAVLTNAELLVGNAEDARKHMKGLHALVTMRGGINTLSAGIQKLLQRLISWTDLTISQLYGTPMTLPLNELWGESFRQLLRPALPSSSSGDAIGQMGATGPITHEAASILRVILPLSHMENTRPVVSVSEDEVVIRLDALAYIERQLHVLNQTAELKYVGSPDNETVSSMTWSAVSLTSAMYVSHWLRGNPLTNRNFLIWTQRLQDILLKLSPDLQEMNSAPSMMLWIRAVGAIASEHQSTHEWFLDKLAETCVIWRLDWEGFRSRLAGFLWIGDRDETRYARLWLNLEDSMAELCPDHV